MGKLIPCGLIEVLPGDSIQQSTSVLTRLQPLLAPMMHPVHVTVRHFFVPHRLVWEDWEDFITGGPDNDDDSVLPTISTGGSGVSVGSLADYLGVTPSVASRDVSALPFRGYALIWNEYFRDQDLQDELVIDFTSGADTTTSTTLKSVAWEKDYFTTARPWEQKGPSITIPLGTTAPVKGIGAENTAGPIANQTVQETGTGATTFPFSRRSSTNDADNRFYMEMSAASGGTAQVYADLANATAATINDLRQAFALQRMAEARAQYGSRYTEYLRYLGVQSSDARLQRPEYLGGGSQLLQISEVLQTAPNTSGTPDVGVGDLSGHGIGVSRSNRYRRFFEEHGYIFSFVTVKPKTMYAQGLARTWTRATKEDFFQKELQFIGQQEVYNQEVYLAHATPSGVFGYQDRYDEYRRTESSIAGEFRTTLNYWHMARIFSSDPALNESFITADPTTRVFSSTSTDPLYMMCQHSIQARRIIAATGANSFIR